MMTARAALRKEASKRRKIMEKIYRSHSKSLEIDCPIIESSDKDGRYWLVQSTVGGSDIYEIREGDASCRCYKKCEDCDLCFHSMSCTCPDYVGNENLCKHIHYWKGIQRGSDSRSDQLIIRNTSDRDENVNYLMAQNSLIDEKTRSVERISEQIREFVYDCESIEEIQSFERKIFNIIENLRDSRESSDIPVKREIKEEEEETPQSPKRIKEEPL